MTFTLAWCAAMTLVLTGCMNINERGVNMTPWQYILDFHFFLGLIFVTLWLNIGICFPHFWPVTQRQYYFLNCYIECINLYRSSGRSPETVRFSRHGFDTTGRISYDGLHKQWYQEKTVWAPCLQERTTLHQGIHRKRIQRIHRSDV